MTVFEPPFLKIMPNEGRYILVSVLDEKQLDTIREVCSLQSRMDYSDDRHLILAVINESELKQLYDYFEPYSRSWRGRYQALAKAVVIASKDVGL